jgi:hypothetical protein
MVEYRWIGPGTGLRQEKKTNWSEGTIDGGGAYFVHGGPMGPREVINSHGLSPMKAREFLTHEETQEPIAGGKMLFSFQVAGGALPANARKSGGVGRLWGYDGHCYVFLAPGGTKYWSTNHVLTTGAEVAFPYIIEVSDIMEYWAPSEAKSGGTNFVKHPWHAVPALFP